ncbi:MAG: sulfatase-like hydrolase/transferase [Wenzhouxiangellaceae bacterium]|nr:sulfatase-like hydrolase/transferase [Wenzhouxiangellaceae bacterium]
MLVLMAVIAPPLVYIPLQIYTANQYEFGASLYDIFPLLLSAAGVLIAVSGLIALFLPRRMHRALLALGAALAALVWIQGQLLIRNYGVLDGSPIDWMGWPGRAVFDSLLWITVLALALIQRRRVARHAGLLALGLLLIQGVPAGWLAYRYEPPPEFHRYNFSEEQKFAFSPERNVIIVVLDAFQSDVFGRLLETEPALNEDFDGFTWYRNALAGYSKTYPSFVLMLAGKWYDNHIPIQDFVNDSLADDSIVRRLKDLGWRVDLFPHIKRVLPPLPEIADNVIASIDCRTVRFESGKLADLGWFRISPHPVKPFWLNGYEWRLASKLLQTCIADKNTATASGESMLSDNTPRHAALRFLRQAQTETQLTLERPGLKLYHLMIPHAPFHLDQDLEVGQLPAGEEGFMRQSRGAVEVVKRFFQTLREHEAYDQSMLIVVSDHGGGEYIDPLALNALEKNVPARHMASGLALALIKPPSARGRLRISDAPVSLADLAPTIAVETGSGLSFTGRNILDIAASEQRERLYRFYAFDGWSGSYLPDMTEYRVDGPTFLAESWSPSGRVFRAQREPEEAERWPYPLGERFGFRPGSPAIQALGNGWSEPGPGGLVWSDGESAEIVVALDEPGNPPLSARFDVLPYTAGGQIDQARVFVTVNGRIEKRWALSERGWIHMDIPANIARDADGLRFEFHFPDAVSPFEMGRSNDSRRLGVALYGMQLENADDDN